MITFWTAAPIAITVAYLLGAFPTAYLAGRLFQGLDIREHGSGSVGATNTLRVLGKWPALAVLLVDVLKGTAAVVLARWLVGPAALAPAPTMDAQTLAPWIVAMAGLAALLGHSRSIWLKFTGGKSVATGLGVLLAISWPAAIGALACFGVVVAIFRIVSLGSVVAALVAVALMFGLGQPLAFQLLIAAGGLYVVVRHRANVGRLLAGTEPRLGSR